MCVYVCIAMSFCMQISCYIAMTNSVAMKFMKTTMLSLSFAFLIFNLLLFQILRLYSIVYVQQHSLIASKTVRY